MLVPACHNLATVVRAGRRKTPDTEETMDTSGKARKTGSAFRMECAVGVNVRAKPGTLWALLTNAAEFPKWNSTVTSVEGQIALGKENCAARDGSTGPRLQAQGDRARA